MPHSPRKDWTGIKWTCSVCGKRYVGRWNEPGEDRHVDYGHGQRTLPGFAELGLTQPTKPPVVPRKLRARRPYQVTQRTCSAKCARARKTERQKMRREAARAAAAKRPHPRQRGLAFRAAMAAVPAAARPAFRQMVRAARRNRGKGAR